MTTYMNVHTSVFFSIFTRETIFVISCLHPRMANPIQNELLFKKELAPKGSKFFHLREAHNAMGDKFILIRVISSGSVPVHLTIFIQL